MWGRDRGDMSGKGGPGDSVRPTRVGLIGEGTYPVVKGGVSTWCDQIVTGLDDHEFSVVTLVGADRKQRWKIPQNVTSVTLVPMWDAPPRARATGRRAESRRVEAALRSLWTAALPGQESERERIARATSALQELARPSAHRLAATLARTSSVESLMTAWNAHRLMHGQLGAFTLAEAAQVARLADRILAVLDTRWPQVDLIHVASNGPASLIALARHWHDGTPVILTEHGVYLRERYLALGDLELSWSVRYALMGLIQLICQVTYEESVALAPVSDFNAGWERHLGADDRRITTVHNGVNAKAYPVLDTEPDVPTVSFVGRIDPLKDLATLIDGFALVHARLPEARLRLFGPVPDQNVAYFAELQARVAGMGLGEVVTFEGPVPGAQLAAAAGHVVALSSISEGLPFTVMESMMCGRATVSTDVGGVAEVTGRDSRAGIIVPPRDPEALAEALHSLLTDDERRHEMGRQARARALEMFTLDLFYKRIRKLYAEANPSPVVHSSQAVNSSEAVSLPEIVSLPEVVSLTDAESLPEVVSLTDAESLPEVVSLTEAESLPEVVSLTGPAAPARERVTIDLRGASVDVRTPQAPVGAGRQGGRHAERTGAAHSSTPTNATPTNLNSTSTTERHGELMASWGGRS